MTWRSWFFIVVKARDWRQWVMCGKTECSRVGLYLFACIVCCLQNNVLRKCKTCAQEMSSDKSTTFQFLAQLVKDGRMESSSGWSRSISPRSCSTSDGERESLTWQLYETPSTVLGIVCFIEYNSSRPTIHLRLIANIWRLLIHFTHIVCHKNTHYNTNVQRMKHLPL